MAVDSLEGVKSAAGYNHSDWAVKRRVCRFLLRWIGFSLLAKIGKVEGIHNVPKSGPALIMINHIAFIDPLVVLYVLERNIVPLAKAEVYDYALLGIFPRLWGVIPIHREEVDRKAVQQVFEVLEAGEMVLVAPEGTRSPALTPGKEGIAYLASRSKVPVVPVAIDETQDFPAFRFSEAWRGPGAQIRFGRPFRFRSQNRRPDRDQLRKMTDEAMYLLAEMLPEHRRGVYADLTKATKETIEWI
jgi:1-acyl-sn-glycerol-3-phosphate acyltransferase